MGDLRERKTQGASPKSLNTEHKVVGKLLRYVSYLVTTSVPQTFSEGRCQSRKKHTGPLMAKDIPVILSVL